MKQIAGVAITLAVGSRYLRFSCRSPVLSLKPSEQDRGERLELDWLSGAVVRRAAAVGLPVPAHKTMYAALAPFAAGTHAI